MVAKPHRPFTKRPRFKAKKSSGIVHIDSCYVYPPNSSSFKISKKNQGIYQIRFQWSSDEHVSMPAFRQDRFLTSFDEICEDLKATLMEHGTLPDSVWECLVTIGRRNVAVYVDNEPVRSVMAMRYEVNKLLEFQPPAWGPS